MGEAQPAAGPTRLAYRPALDGVRALAVLAVLAYHAGWDGLPGGFLGVDVFLVLSGYLITALLLAEWEAHGSVRLRSFWERRLRRLVPALVLVVGAVLVHAAVTGAVASVRGDAVASLTWVQNWYLALSDASYFDALREASPLRHAWSLALEAQWYLLWPPVLLGLLALTRGRLLVVGLVTAALAAASALVMAGGFDVTSDPSRLYYGTDTRGHVLLVGALAALALHGRRLPDAPLRWSALGLAGTAGVAWSMHRVGDLDPALYRGGFALVALSATFLLAAALAPRSLPQRVLSVEPLPALGRISYGVYLWHWPLYLWLGPNLAATALAIAAAAASYRLVEMPVRLAPPNRRPVYGGLALGATAILVGVALGAPRPPAPQPSLALPAAERSVVPQVAGGDSEQARAATDADPGVERVLVAGDSVAFTLGEHFRPEWVGGAFSVDYGATFLGCGVVTGQPLKDGRPVHVSDPTCLEWKQRWQERIAAVDPDVVVVLIGAWEVLDRRIDGVEYEAGTGPYEGYLLEQIDAAIDIVVAGEARPVLLTAPCYRPASGPGDDKLSDRRDDGRVRWFNDVLRRAASRHGAAPLVVDLFGFACPGGELVRESGGVGLHTDGIHLTAAGSERVWRWLAGRL